MEKIIKIKNKNSLQKKKGKGWLSGSWLNAGREQ